MKLDQSFSELAFEGLKPHPTDPTRWCGAFTALRSDGTRVYSVLHVIPEEGIEGLSRRLRMQIQVLESLRTCECTVTTSCDLHRP